MVRDVLVMCLFTALILGWSVPDLQGSARINRWLTYGVVAACIAVWLYMQLTFQVPRPTVWFQKLMEPYVPQSP
ncbi:MULTISPECIES: hypothetical protein [Paenibacillus]|uniref:hypothetical protein n=1 Tax=Paenibacillus TaxID=44249 RepID=UPI0022B8BEC6|nr:hypothetical protein [Paenibacillus caseinilyticus]MCZ8521132.1 hypothetical protein [Paenibacillus caseinilyticus]